MNKRDWFAFAGLIYVAAWVVGLLIEFDTPPSNVTRWLHYAAIAFIVLALAATLVMGLSIYNQVQTVIAAQAQPFLDSINSPTNPNVRLTSLADLLKLPGYQGEARQTFYQDLKPEERVALFEQTDSHSTGSDLITVIQGVYTDPNLQNNDQENAFDLNNKNSGIYFDRGLAYAALDLPEAALPQFATVTSIATPTFTRVSVMATPTSPSGTATFTPPVGPPLTTTFTLLAPLALDEPSYGPTTFQWQWSGPLPAEYGFEVRVWKEGQPPTGVHNAVLDNQNGTIKNLGNNTYQLQTNIKDAAGVLGNSGVYLWTVGLVKISPKYSDLGLQAPPARLRFAAPGGSGSGGGTGGGVGIDLEQIQNIMNRDIDTRIIVALISFLAGILVALIGGLTKLLEYRIERRKLEVEERHSITAVVGSSQSNFVRASRDLYRRISSFFDHPDSARQWLKPEPTPESDEHYLREFVRLLFNFIAWGRITQDTINSLPTTLTKERTDLQQTFVFVDLALDILAYGKLFREIDAYDAENQDLCLFIGTIDAIADAGSRLWKEGEQNISRAAFDNLYHSPESSITALRRFFILLHDDKAGSAGFIIARLAALRAVLAGFLINYSWTIYIPDERTLVKELQKHLQYASETSKVDLPFVDFVPQNLGELMNLYQCKLFRLP